MIPDYISKKLYIYLKYTTIFVFINIIIHYYDSDHKSNSSFYHKYYLPITLILLTLIIITSIFRFVNLRSHDLFYTNW